MNGKMIKRIAAGILTTVLVAGTLTACSPTPAQSTASTAGEKTTESGAATTDSGSFIADRTITIQAYVDDIGNSLPKDMNNTEVMKKITELTGIKLNVQYTPGDSDAAVMAAQLASGTIPDMIISYLDNSTRPEFPILLKAAKEGMFANVQDYIKNSKVYSKYMEDNYLPSDTKKNIMFREDLDGVYIVSRGVSAEDTSMIFDPEENYKGGMYIQKAIADSLKIDVKTINTQDQFYDLLKKIKDGGFKDNNGNAVYPLGPKYWGGSYDSIKFACPGLIWGVSDGYNLDKDGNVKHEAEMESIYTEINYVRKLIDEGLMNPEYFTMDATRAKEVSESKNSAIISDVHNYIDLIYKSDEWIPLGPLNDISGNNKTVTSGKSASGCFAISAKAEKPEEIFKFMDWISSKEGQLIAEYGVEGVSYDMVDGNPVLNAEALKAVNDGDIEYMVNKIGAS
ncbi:MAG: extracellular solute-binding protein, partial [Oscillospiraceae bacterium]